MINNFITNTGLGNTLKERVTTIISRTAELKILVGFFYFSGWNKIYKSLKANNYISLKILVGLEVEKHLAGLIELGNTDQSLSNEEHFSKFLVSLGNALNNSEMDNEEFYNQIEFFIKLIEEDKLIIKKTLNPNHAKLYLFKYNSDEAKYTNKNGRFITGSSNLTKAGLHNQEEFNVEIGDYGFDDAEKYFDNLWETAIPITEAENGKPDLLDFLKNRTQTANITPYEAYAFILKTYIELQEIKKIDPYVIRLLENNGFDKYKYQLDAVNQALNVLEKNNGVIIADVVGLGKSVIASLIAAQLKERGLILCPPGLKPAWKEYRTKFKLHNWDIESIGKIEEVAERVLNSDDDYKIVIVDEAHRFRNQDTADYEALADICRGKKVILLTATPFNNSPADIFSLLKLFIVPGKSTITLEEDLEAKFNEYNYRFKNISFILKNYNSKKEDNRKKAERKFRMMFDSQTPFDIKKVKEDAHNMASDIRSKIHSVTIRRNRIDLQSDFEYKDEINNLSKVSDPVEMFFELSKEQAQFYDEIIEKYFAVEGLFKGAIYQPFIYENKPKDEDDLNEEENRTLLQQKNLYDFMRRLLVKRFESSFGAFDKSIERFLKTHKMVKSFIVKSNKYILDRKVIEKIYNTDEEKDDFILEDIEAALIEFEKNAHIKTSPKHAKIYNIKDFHFKDKFLNDLDNDIKIFQEIQDKINKLKLVKTDPKRKSVFSKIKKILSSDENPKRKVIIFTEYTDTVKHLKKYFLQKMPNKVLFCDGMVSKQFSDTLNQNFNAKSEIQKDDFDLLITSDKLSEGFNLNRAGLIINYDIPWNPTRVIQRVGRINRIGTKVFDNLLIYNFFPTERGADVVRSRQIASQKMFLIHNALGEDVKIFDIDEEPTASGLYLKINSIPDEDEDIHINTLVRNEFNNICNNHPEIIERISKLPNRTKTAKLFNSSNTIVFRKKGLSLFSFISTIADEKIEIEEKSFQELFSYIKSEFDTEKKSLSSDFWKCYEKIKEYNPKQKSSTTNKSLETVALKDLKILLAKNKSALKEYLLDFINTLIKDLKKYKTLPKHTVRKLVNPDKKGKNFNKYIEQIEELRRKIGNNYLEIILNRISDLDEDVIIAIENKTIYLDCI